MPGTRLITLEGNLKGFWGWDETLHSYKWTGPPVLPQWAPPGYPSVPSWPLPGTTGARGKQITSKPVPVTPNVPTTPIVDPYAPTVQTSIIPGIDNMTLLLIGGAIFLIYYFS